MKKLSLILVSCLAIALLGPLIYDLTMTKWIISQRNHTLEVQKDMSNLGIQIVYADFDRIASGQSSIYPSDLGISTEAEYIKFLEDELEIDCSGYHLENKSEQNGSANSLHATRSVLG
jgi:hypothetical protein